MGSVTSYWASSDARSAGMAGVWVERERRALLRNRHGHWQPKEYEVPHELWLRVGEDA